jgi:diguanylate cyclase (GGDEF)-like protein
VLSSGGPVRLDGSPEALGYYEGRAPVSGFCGVPLSERDGTLVGALVADRVAGFSPDEERVLLALAAEVTRAIEAERLLGAVRREKEEKARFFRALEELNRTSTVAAAADTAVAQARRMCASLDLCAITLVIEGSGDRPRHQIQAVEGDASGSLRDLTFADNAGLVSNVVKLGAPLPGRALGAMDRVVIFDNGTVLRGLQALKIFPLRAGETTVGTLVCGSRKPDGLPEGAQRELSMLALQAAESLVRTQLYERTERLATTDGLTGLANRRAFNQALQTRLREAQRYKRPLSLLDVDHFKKVNDAHGHPAGDAVLKGVAALAQKQARETDVVARYGGEEMALVLPETDAKGALVIAERIRAAVHAAQHATERGPVKVSISIGVATWPGGGESPEELLEAADRALYRAKQGGRNRVEVARGRAAA